MIQNKKRIISLILMLTLLVSALVVGAVTASAAETYQKATSIAVGDTVVLVNEAAGMELNGISTTNTKYGIEVGYSTAPAGAYALTVEAGYTSGTYSFKTPNGQYLYWTSGNSLNVNSTLSAKTSWTVDFDSDGNAVIKNSGDPNRQIFWNSSSPRFACYTTTTQSAVQLYKLVQNDTPACDHANATKVTTDATCTEAGSIKITCTCGYTNTEEIPAPGHNYVNGTCSACGANEPNYVFKKVTATPADWSGTYLIVYEGGSVAFNGALTTLDATSNHIGITINNGEIAFIEQLNESTFIIAKSDSGYTIMSASGYYIGQTTNANGLKYSTSTIYTNTLSLNSDETVNFVSGGAYLRYNSAADQMRFRYYTSSTYSNQKAIVLYKLVEKETVVCTHEEAVYTSNNDGTHNVVCKCGYAENNIACSGGETSCVSGKLCEFCGFEYDTEKKNHNYLGGYCSVCNKAAPDFSGRYYIAAIRSSGNYWYMTNVIDGKSDRYLIADSGVTELPPQISEHVLSQIFVLESVGNGEYYIYAEGITGDAKYLGWTSGNSGTLVEKESKDVVLLTVDYLESEVFNIHFAASDAERYLALNGTTGNDYFAFYKSGQKQDLSLIPVSDHVYADATCTAPKTCACGATEGEALGHNHENCPHVACVGDDYYTDLQDAVNAAGNDDVIIVLVDINLGSAITISGKKVTLNLNTKTLTANNFANEKGVCEVLYITNNANVIITGEGTLISGTNADTNSVVSVLGGSTLTIVSGTFTSEAIGDVIYAKEGSKVYIEGGRFEAKNAYYGKYYVLDVDESYEATAEKKSAFYVTGGTFVNFNPANHTNDGKGYTNKVDEGYAVVQNGNEYTVEKLDDVIGAPVDGKITLDKDITISGDLAIVPGTTLDINGKTITATGGIVTFGTNQIIDSGETKGLIKVAKGKLVFTEGGESTLVPVWNEKDGYFLANITDQFASDVVESENDDSFSVTFRPSLDSNSDLNLSVFGNGAVGNGIKFIIKITGTNAQGTKDLFVGSVSDSIIAQAYGNNGAIRITIKGADLNEYTEFNVQLIITNDTSLTHTKTICSYTKDDNGNVCVK